MSVPDERFSPDEPGHLEPLSDVLGLLKPRTYRVHGVRAGGEWALRFPEPAGIKFNAVIAGDCWLRIDDDPVPYHLSTGDCFLLTSRRSFVLASDLSLPAVDGPSSLIRERPGLARYQSGDGWFLVGGQYIFDGDYLGSLFGQLPAVIVVRADRPEAAVLRWALDLLAAELLNRQPGGALTAEHLAHIMLIQVLRLYVASTGGPGQGWLAALAHPRLSVAIGAMHADVRRRWTLHALARRAGMSRSSFAATFKDLVGRSPFDYLLRWRMQLASARLRDTDAGVAAIGRDVGYESEAAFSTAFKRVHGHSPRVHRRGRAM